MRARNAAKRRRTWRPRRPRQPLVVSGHLQLPERPRRWELDLILSPMLDRLRAIETEAHRNDGKS